MDNPVAPLVPPVGGKPKALSPATAVRVMRSVDYTERAARVGMPREGGAPKGWAYPAYVMKTTTTVTARSGATYGTGSAKLQVDTGTALADDAETVVVKNLTDKVVASGAYVVVAWALGQWWVVAVGSCANLT